MWRQKKNLSSRVLSGKTRLSSLLKTYSNKTNQISWEKLLPLLERLKKKNRSHHYIFICTCVITSYWLHHYSHFTSLQFHVPVHFCNWETSALWARGMQRGIIHELNLKKLNDCKQMPHENTLIAKVSPRLCAVLSLSGSATIHQRESELFEWTR